ncbi:MAG: glycosyltransferase [Opitutae bacterium]|nr:glycosyltransferase [Opitutae bacterium]
MLLLDASHTSHTRAQTGIQRVTRSLFAELALTQPTAGVCYDPGLRAWRTLNAGELDHLRPDQPATKSRGSKWSLRQRLASHTRRLLGFVPALPAATGFVCPEIFSPKVAANLPAIFARVRGPRVAIFCDAIALQYPELTPPATVARFPAYLRELLAFDGVAAISETSAEILRAYWRWLGVAAPPVVRALPLGLAKCHIISDTSPGLRPPRLLCVSTVEGRKNHLALLEACEKLWAEGLAFELELIGLARADTAAPALAKIAALRRAGLPLFYVGSVPEAELHAAYGRCAFTVYPSLTEGFGLPVFESLGYGKPCVCSAHGALGEAARGGGDKCGSLGGCVALDRVDAPSLAAAIRRLLENPAELAALAAAARARPFRTWRDYAADLTGWMSKLPRRS